ILELAIVGALLNVLFGFRGLGFGRLQESGIAVLPFVLKGLPGPLAVIFVPQRPEKACGEDHHRNHVIKRVRFRDYRILLGNRLFRQHSLPEGRQSFVFQRWQNPRTNDREPTTALNVKPRRNPHVLDMPQEPQQHLARQSDHDEQEDHHDVVLQKAHALVIFRVITAEKGMNRESADQEIAPDDDRAEKSLAKVRGDAEYVRQIAVHLVNKSIMVPGLPRPEPLPAWTSNESTNDDHRYPEDQEAKQECADGELALLPRVITTAKWICVDIRNHHQADNDQRRHDHAGDPWIEIHQHFL